MRRGEATRERLPAAAERAVLAKGFAATLIDELIAEVGITKSGFFYHFRDKNELALAVLERYLTEDQVHAGSGGLHKAAERKTPEDEHATPGRRGPGSV